MELSGFEFGSLAGKLDSALAGYYVNNVYLTGSSSVVLRMHRSDRPELSLVISPRLGAWLSRSEFPRAPLDPFLSALRGRLIRAKFVAVKSFEGERILRLEFSLGEERLAVVGEFFGAGNVLLLDSDGVIVACLNRIEAKARILRPGLTYTLPASKALPLSKVDTAHLSTILASNQPVEKLLGRGLAAPRRVIEETLRRSGIEKGRDGSSLGQAEVLRLADTLKAIQVESTSSTRLYVYYADDEPCEVSVIPLTLGTEYKLKEHDDLLQVLDELFTPLILQGSLDEMTKKPADDLRKMESSISSKKAEAALLYERAAKLRAIAQGLMTGKVDSSSAAAALRAVDPSYGMDEGTGVWQVGEHGFKVESTYSLASKVFSEAKRLNASLAKLEEAIAKLEARRNALAERLTTATREGTAARPKRERKWFEKFRWFCTSEGILALGGRDAGSNSLLIRRHLEPTDLVFHAEIAGSPFFLLKGGQSAGEQSRAEAASATVAFSRAWREGLASADAYYVKPDQVLKGAPSGQFLPRGSFVIEGERVYVKGIELRSAVGLGVFEGNYYVMGGPSSALAATCLAVVEVAPGHLQPSDAARKLKNELLDHLEGKPKEFVHQSPLEDFVRCLPSGKVRPVRLLRGRLAPSTKG